jgi:pimeloyl-ACP methyl ester carboxylesterase
MKTLFFLFALLLVINQSFASHSNRSSYPFEVAVSGKGGKSIIFIPGFGCSGGVWDDTKANFQNYTCYTLTMAGFAGVKPQPGASFKSWEDGIARYIKDNNIKTPVLIGHSMGGGLALAIASDYPGLIEKVIVVDALPCLAAIMDPNFKPSDNCPFTSQLLSASNEQFLAMQKNGIGRLVADTTKYNMIVDWTTKSDRATFANMYCNFSNTDLRESIVAIQCPVYVLLESYFKNMKPAIEEQYKNCKDSHLLYANQGLHFIMFDDVNWYMEQLKTILQ